MTHLAPAEAAAVVADRMMSRADALRVDAATWLIAAAQGLRSEQTPDSLEALQNSALEVVDAIVLAIRSDDRAAELLARGGNHG